MVKRGRSSNDGKPWKCRCGNVNKPTKHRFFKLPAFQCGKCQTKLALDFKFCLGEIEAGGKSLIGEVYDQGNEPLCVPFAYAKAAEITERVFLINNGMDPELVIPIDPFELERRFLDKRPDGGPSGVGLTKDAGLHKVLHMGLILRSEGIQRIDVGPEVIQLEESEIFNQDGTYIAADVSSIPRDAFENICHAMAEGIPLVATYLVGKARGRVPYCKSYKSPSLRRIRDKKGKEIGHAVVLIGAGMQKGKLYFYFLNSWTKRFCARRNKKGEIIRGGIGKIRESDLTKNVIKLSPPHEAGGERRLEDQPVFDISNINYVLMKGMEKQSTAQMLQRLRDREAANGGYIPAGHDDDGIFRDDEGVHKVVVTNVST
ncbi:unnamed protein product [Urochloa decumbens]|uniref:Uncharacterized protein n=1 Tax=Urochloa decumbens TaxID=240449 RepID=A0ABC9AZ78_9POAL